MSEAFDPEKVYRWEDDQRDGTGWTVVRAEDYDKLLALYREAAKEIADWRHEARC